MRGSQIMWFLCSLLITALLLFSAAELAFGLMVAAACSRAKIAAIMAPILHLASLMPRYIFFRTGSRVLIQCRCFASVLVVCFICPSSSQPKCVDGLA